MPASTFAEPAVNWLAAPFNAPAFSAIDAAPALICCCLSFKVFKPAPTFATPCVYCDIPCSRLLAPLAACCAPCCNCTVPS
ncbi:hypothetical protein OL548_32915 [Lysinibacillus sp. MHQ-1]|nr:hypothetical protein OL548_32915 [Lysinibacillus sp. MHQ-1]